MYCRNGPPLTPARPNAGVIWSKEEQKSKLGAVAEVLVSCCSTVQLSADDQELEVADRAAFFKECKDGGKYADITGIYRHNDSVSSVGLFDKELIEALPSSVKYICHNGAGYDQSE